MAHVFHADNTARAGNSEPTPVGSVRSEGRLSGLTLKEGGGGRRNPFTTFFRVWARVVRLSQ